MGRSIHIAPTMGLAGVPATIGLGVINKRIDPMAALGLLTAAYTFYNPYTGTWDMATGMANYGCIGLGCGISMLFSKLGWNNRLPPHINI